jgi:hypothetical protein
MTCIKILASQMGVVSCGDGGRDSSVHILSCGACAFRVGRRMRMRCEDVGFPDQRGVVVTPSEQAFLVLEENVWREHARVHARPVLCPLAFVVEVCTWMPRVIPFSTHSSVASPAQVTSRRGCAHSPSTHSTGTRSRQGPEHAHADDKPHEHTAHTARAHRRAQRQAHRCGVGRPTPMPAFTGCCGPPPPAHLRHLGAVCVALAGSLALAKCAKGAAGNKRRHPAPGSSRPWSHIIHQWTVNAGSSCGRPCWPFHGAGRPHGAACSTAPAPQFTARAHTQRLCSKVRAPGTPGRAQPPPPPAHSPRAASAPYADLVLHARFWRRLSPASRPALERGWLKISTTFANRPLQLSSKKVDFREGWNDPL